MANARGPAPPEEGGEYRLVVRFPGELGWRLRELAERNRRSINNEIIVRVERGIDAETAPELLA